jgi:hypothetical protein
VAIADKFHCRKDALQAKIANMWRTISLVVIGFWLVMTSMLVRFVWFPEGSHFSDVPPSTVLRHFLEQSSAVGTSMNTSGNLFVYHHDEKIGIANVRCTRLRPGAQDFMVRMECFLDRNAVPFTEEKVTCTLSLKLLNVDQFGELKGKIRVDRTPWLTEFHWQKGQRVPAISVHAPEESGINDAMIQLMLAQALLGGGAPGMPADAAEAAGADGSGLLRIRARENAMEFAGQKSQGHLLEFTVLDRWKARAFITEAGEFVLLDLPEGYRLVEPVIHGLVRDYDADDEEEFPSVKEAAKVQGGK